MGYTKEGQNIIVYPTFYVNVLILTYLDICPGVVYCHCPCMHVHVHVLFIGLARMHEDMLFYRGECVIHRTIQVFSFLGDFGVFYELGQYDLLYTYGTIT